MLHSSGASSRLEAGRTLALKRTRHRLLGVGDSDNSGRLDNFDIDACVALIGGG
jgi:hypothetical protein